MRYVEVGGAQQKRIHHKHHICIQLTRDLNEISGASSASPLFSAVIEVVLLCCSMPRLLSFVGSDGIKAVSTSSDRDILIAHAPAGHVQTKGLWNRQTCNCSSNIIYICGYYL